MLRHNLKSVRPSGAVRSLKRLRVHIVSKKNDPSFHLEIHVVGRIIKRLGAPVKLTSEPVVQALKKHLAKTKYFLFRLVFDDVEIYGEKALFFKIPVDDESMF